MKNCINCDKEFKPNRTGTNQSFCSRSCYVSYNATTINNCLKCGKETKSKFCSRSCSASYNNSIKPKRVAKPKPPKQEKVQISPEEKYKAYRARMNEANARYISRRKFQTPADEDVKALQEFYANCPTGYEVDHIITISKGGLHSLSNLQYLPWQENRRKSNKITGTG